MKQLLKAALFSAMAAAPFLSVNAQAGNPVMYTQQTPASTVRVMVYQDGRPAAGAKVKLYGADGNMRNEYRTNSHGMLVINSLNAPGSLKLVAETRMGMSMAEEVSLHAHFDK